MKPDWGSVAAGSVLAFVAGLLVTDALGAKGRYQIAPLSAGVVARIDTRTGEVMGCRADRDAWPRFDCAAPMGTR